MLIAPVFVKTLVSLLAACFLFGGCAEMPTSSSDPTTALAASPTAANTIAAGVFSSGQRERGEIEYMRTCKRCHQRDLAGDFIEDAPPLIGDEFMSNWKPWTLGDLFEFLTTDMPPKPKERREMSAENYADILAFILDKNGFPAGNDELPPAFEPLSTIEMNVGE